MSTANKTVQVLDATHGRILCLADIRGKLSALNDMAREAGAVAVIHTGDFGFFEESSLLGVNDKTLRHLTMYSPLIPAAQREHLLSLESVSTIRQTVTISLLSEFPLLVSGTIRLDVPVYTTYGACEDVHVLEKLRVGTYSIPNLHVIDEATSEAVDVGGVRLRLLGLGGAMVPHKMFDNGDGKATMAGAGGTMWCTALQIGELIDTAQRVHDTSEVRVLVSHASPGRDGIVGLLAGGGTGGKGVKADLTLSGGLHFRYASSWNEFSVQGGIEGWRAKLKDGKDGFEKIWTAVRPQVEVAVSADQRVLLEKFLAILEGAGGAGTGEEAAWKNCWNWNLCDAAYGSLVLDIREGRISAELKSQGFNYAYRRANVTTTAATPEVPSPTVENKTQKKKERKKPAKEEVEAASPTTDGRRTPGGKKNPWTIFMRFPGLAAPPAEADIREYFLESKAGITRVTVPQGNAGKPRIAYVEWADERGMRDALDEHREKLGESECVPDVQQASDPASRHQQGDGSGGRGRAGRGRGAFAARGFAAAGLTAGRGRGADAEAT